jgi:hypothetical protein
MIREDEFSHRLNKNAKFCGFTPLHYASLIDSYEGVKLLLQGGRMNIIFYGLATSYVSTVEVKCPGYEVDRLAVTRF